MLGFLIGSSPLVDVTHLVEVADGQFDADQIQVVVRFVCGNLLMFSKLLRMKLWLKKEIHMKHMKQSCRQ